MDYGFRTYEPVTIARPGQSLGEAVVSWGKEEKVSVSTIEELTIGVPRGSQGELTREIDWKKDLTAPLHKGEVLGELVIKRGGIEIARVDIAADYDVERANILQMLVRMSKRLLQSIVPGKPSD